MLRKIITILILLMTINANLRHLQFTHFVPGYTNHQPNDDTYGYFPFLNPFDPYLPISFTTGIGGNLKGPQFIVKCFPPLKFINGACQCPQNGRLIRGRCFSGDGNQQQIPDKENQIANQPNPKDSTDPVEQPQLTKQPEPTPSTQTKEEIKNTEQVTEKNKEQEKVDPVQEEKTDSEPKVIGTFVDPDDLSGLSFIFRQFNGTNNNIANPQWGSKGVPLERRAPAFYKDGQSEPVDSLPNPRLISNQVGTVEGPLKINEDGITMAFTIFGQFIDHDIDFTPSGNSENMDIPIPSGDPFFQNRQFLRFRRSKFIEGLTPRRHPNDVTSWIDGSQIYGSSEAVARQLRLFSQGKMRTSEGNLLPKRSGLFIAGDSRVNENSILASYHTIFIRQHNRICERLIADNPKLSDEEIFRSARNYVIGLLQKIILYDFVPIFLGTKFDEIVGQYKGYKSDLNPTIPTQFSSGAYRIGHALLVDNYPLVDSDGVKYKQHKLGQMFFNSQLVSEKFIDDIFRGLQINLLKQKSSKLADQIRNLLVLDPARRQIKLDLFSINIQRGRDIGLPTYNQARRAFGLSPVSSFEEILQPNSSDLAQKLTSLYNSPENLDLWLGILVEDHVEGGILGELGVEIIGQTFRNLRDGDRFWFEATYPEKVIEEIKNTTFSDIIRRNSNAKQISDDIFRSND